jgi:hypothetical protein
MTLSSGTADPANGSDEYESNQLEVQLDGDCLRKTMRRLELSPDARDALVAQSGELIKKIVATYSTEYGGGEVGAAGTSRVLDASRRPRSSELGPTGLLYGRIQSGKTAAMIVTTAMAIDNGFRVVVLLTTNFVELVKQTKDRFNDLDRALVHASTEPDAWSNDVKNITKHVATRGPVVICAKHGGHLENVSQLLTRIGASSFPALILDDEADQASLDNNTRARSMGKDLDPTMIHNLIRDLRVKLVHHIFLQVTATPYALLLQNVDNPARPTFPFLLEPGQGYTGGEHFFSREFIGSDNEPLAKPPLYFVDEDEAKEIERGPNSAPSGLERAVSYFLVAAAAQALLDEDSYKQSQNFLCHTSHKKAEHDKLSVLIQNFLSRFEDELAGRTGKASQLVRASYEELKRTLPTAPPFEEVVTDIVDRLPRRKMRIVNSEGRTGEEVRGAPNFIIGGNIIGRGLTIPNLLVTYYLRKPQISQMDTMLQHARMFGYRKRLMPYTRVFLPRSLAERFHRIHEAEAELRKLIPTVDALRALPVRVVGELRPTRYGVLDANNVTFFRTGQHLFTSTPDYSLSDARIQTIEKCLARIFNVENPTEAIFDGEGVASRKEVSTDDLIELLRAFPSIDDDQESESIVTLLRTLDKRSGGLRPGVAWRTMRRKEKGSPDLPTGAASGDELKALRGLRGPTLFVFRQVDQCRQWDNRLFWYPSLILDGGMPTHVYNQTVADEEQHEAK